MKMKSTNIQRRSFTASFAILLAGIFGALVVTTGFSSAGAQSQRAPTLRIVSEDGNRLPVVVITGEDIRHLPPGESRIVQNTGSGDATAAQKSGNVYTITFGGSATSVPLTKTGTGRLALPNSNNDKIGEGNLILSGSAAVADERLTLSGSGLGVVYEFRNLSSQEFDRIFMAGGAKLQTYVGKLRPAAMKGWPFKRLVIEVH